MLILFTRYYHKVNDQGRGLPFFLPKIKAAFVEITLKGKNSSTQSPQFRSFLLVSEPFLMWPEC